MELKGTKEIMAALSALSADLQASVIRSFNRKAVKEKGVAPWESAMISSRAQNNIKIQSVKGSKTAVIVGPGSDTYFERWLQGGTSKRSTSKGANRGRISGNYKLDTAINSAVNPIINYYNEEFGKRIERTLKQKLGSTQRRIGRI